LALSGQFGHCDGDCHKTGYGNVPVVMSAKLNSKAHIKYGRVEVVAQLPKGDWLWPGTFSDIIYLRILRLHANGEVTVITVIVAVIR